MKQDVILVLDCGATNVRAIAVDRQGKIVARASTANASDIVRRGDLFKISEERCKKVKSAVRQRVNKNTIQDKLSTKQSINTRSTKHSR